MESTTTSYRSLRELGPKAVLTVALALLALVVALVASFYFNAPVGAQGAWSGPIVSPYSLKDNPLRTGSQTRVEAQSPREPAADEWVAEDGAVSDLYLGWFSRMEQARRLGVR